jgi:hypothetical protein
MNIVRKLSLASVLLVLSASHALTAKPVDFVRQVKPILQVHCISCHGPEEIEAGLRLDFGVLLQRGGDRGAAIVPGKPEASLLFQTLIGKGKVPQMPFELPKLPAEKIETIRLWIEQGAKIPESDRPSVDGTRSEHWAFQPIERPLYPHVKQSNWPRNGIDWFVLARLEAEGLAPSPEADRSTLIRRLHLDLHGVLPSPEDVAAFRADDEPGAYERLVDRLLASPRYGERWGRHWLDIARYADSNGFTIDGPRSIWPYRDWVIRALNSDLSFDQFVIEQLAGDLLPDATRDQIVATGFHRNTLINQEGGTDQEQFRVESIVDRINTTGAAFFGITIGCAQCHVHKYDPFTQREYYELFAIFNNCDEPIIPLPSERQAAEQKRVREGLVEVREQLKKYDAARAAGQPDWEKEYAALPRAEWTPLKPIEFVSKAGAVINALDGHTLIVGGNGNIPAQDVYTVVADMPIETITAIRLEALTNSGLPKNGPGFAPDGNFVLSEFELGIPGSGDSGELTTIALASGTTEWQQEGYSVGLAIDGNQKSGWAIGGVKAGSMNVNREAIFVLEEPVKGAGTRLQIRMHHNHNVNKSLIGCFRISVTGQSTREPLVPVGLQTVLDVVADKRDDAQKALLVAAYGSSDKSRKPLEDRLTKLKSDESQLKAAIPTTMALKERITNPRETNIHIRGNFLDKGAKVAPRVPAVLPQLPETESPANRLDFARWLFSPDHPLTARVTVNRFWQRFFGIGIVETEDDFGTQGSLPTHPKLLDWLASEFIRQEWGIKSMHRLIVTSATWRQSSRLTRELLQRDPRNRLLARQSRIRLEAECIRDVALSASGLLSQKMLGPGVYPPQPKGIYVVTQVSKQWPESKGDDRYRRAMYTYFWRSSPYPMLPTFDAPDANGTCTRRSRSNTPLQALTLANDASFMELARAFSDRILREASGYDEARLTYAFELALARSPSARERETLLAYVAAQHAYFTSDDEAAKSIASSSRPQTADAATSAAWTTLARVLLNVDEFITRE